MLNFRKILDDIKGFTQPLLDTGQNIAEEFNPSNLLDKIKPFAQALYKPVKETEDLIFEQTPFKQARQFGQQVAEEQKVMEREAGIDLPGPAIMFDVGSLEKVGTKAVKETAEAVAPKVFSGFKDLTTKFLEYAKGKTTLSRQEIMDFAGRPELKKGEADLLLKKLEEFEPKKQVSDSLADKMRKAVYPDAPEIKIGDKNPTFSEPEILPIKSFEPSEYAKFSDIRKPHKFTDYQKKLGLTEGENLSERNQTINNYKTKIINNEPIPPAIGIRHIDNTGTWIEIEDGHHKIQAALELGVDNFPVQIKRTIVDKNLKLPAQEFADSIRRDLLELKPNSRRISLKESSFQGYNIDAREGTNIGKNYEEVIIESPITTNGSPTHYPNSKNYFAHARGDEVVESGKKIWREQEIQSDLLQKEGMERFLENSDPISLLMSDLSDRLKRGWSLEDLIKKHNLSSANVAKIEKASIGLNPIDYGERAMKELSTIKRMIKDIPNPKIAEGTQLQPFTNDRFGERIMRERIKAKAQAGYEKYRLPTGETIGKIEGFQANTWNIADEFGDFSALENASELKVGATVTQGYADNAQHGGGDWIITDILGDGRFKALPKHSSVSSAEAIARKEAQEPLVNIGGQYYNPEYKETFDLTGKSNPQAKRYENWGKFLKNKYGGKEVTDTQGNSWIEIDLKPEQGKLPVEAFGVVPLFLTDQLLMNQDENKPSPADMFRRVLEFIKNPLTSVSEFRGQPFKYQPKLMTDFKQVQRLVPDKSKPDEWYRPQPVPKQWQPMIQEAYERTQLPPGILEAVIMKESDMGASSDNITGFYQDSEYDLSTPKGLIDAAADYLNKRKVEVDSSGKIIKEYTDPVDLYMNRYYTKKKADKDRKIFQYYFDNYRKLYEEDNLA